MAPLSLKIVQGGGAITRTVLFDTTMRVSEAHEIVKEKVLLDGPQNDYGLFLTSADDELSGVWLENHRTLDYYMLRDGDSLHYMCRTRNLRVRMLDGSEKTLKIDESKCVSDLMKVICNKIGITNHDEYGLCFENTSEQPQEDKPATGTLTLKRTQRDRQTREKDAKLEQLSKKLKTDDNVKWLEQQRTLREIGVDPKETLLLKRRLFYSDRNVDAHDPVQLNLLYVQTRDAILDGRQAITEDKAIEFAGIQCQVQYGDFQEDKHKPGFIENLKEFLPEQYASSWGVERKVLKEHSKHQGLSPLEAKHLYTKNARELPTYGVTFFLVKEQQKGKKKLVPRLLGINAESILRLDEVTKEILQVWMLTQVKTFRAGKETFTLDFGDYSDKEYTVKTNEAHRIRDILQGYIDIIHRSYAGPFNAAQVEGMAICEDNVQSAKGQIIQNVVPMKVVEQSYVGPSKLVPFVQGSQATQGTQIMTVKQVLATKKGAVTHRGIAGEAGVRSNNSMEYLKMLKRLNSNAVQTVEFLSDPFNKREEKIQKVNTLASIVEENMNSIIEGVHKSVEKDNDEVKKKLLSKLDELCVGFKLLISTSKQNDFGTPESLTTAQQAIEKIVGLCTNMFCSLDPDIKRRSKILKRFHSSFIADEKTEATLRRGSFLAAAAHACKTVDNAKSELETTFEGALPEGHEVEKLEREARKKIGKLTAAVALLMSAQADPNNPDYTAAITSMTTVDELLPELIQDAKALGSVKDEKSRLTLFSKMRSLCDAARNICSLTGDEDKEQIQELAYNYAKASDKLVFTFGRGTVAEKENEILDLARDVGQKTSLLLMKTHELINLAESDPRAAELDMAGVRCADASKMLLACSQLTASSIDEPHCQSAMTAIAESLSSCAQHLAATWKPIVDEPGHRMFEESLIAHMMDLMKALDRLKEAYADLSAEDANKNYDPNVKQKERLKFVANMKSTLNKIEDAQKELDKPFMGKVDDVNIKELQRVVGDQLSLLNASIASMIRATADRECPDYGTAEEAFSIISEMMPIFVQDVKTISATKDEKAGRVLLNEIRELCQATRDVCSVMELETVNEGNDASSKFIRHSTNLCHEFIPVVYPGEENRIIELSRTTSEKASQLLEPVNQLVDKVGGEDGQKLDDCGAKLVDTVQVLLTTAQITAPSFADSRCQSTMQAAADDVSSKSKKLAATWKPLVRDPESQTLRNNLDTRLAGLNRALDHLRDACKRFGTVKKDMLPVKKSNSKEKNRIKFATTMSLMNNKMLTAERNLQEQVADKANYTNATVLERNLGKRLAQLNAAIASLVRATTDSENIDYDMAEQSISAISQIVPDVIKDTKSLSTLKDKTAQRAMLAELKNLFDATREICKHTEQGNSKALNETTLKFADASKKLTFVFNPRSYSRKENQILDLSKTACAMASTMLTNVHQLAESVGGDDGNRLDNCGVNVVNTAKTLLTTAQLLETSLGDPSCKSTMLSTIDDVFASSRELGSAWSPIKQDKKYKKKIENLEKERGELDVALNNLRATCVEINEIPNEDTMSVAKPSGKEKERIKFVTAMSLTKNKMLNLEKDLQEPVVGKINDTDASVLQRNLGYHLDQLNAAIASLVRGTTDPENVDYDLAEQSISTISQMIPDVINEMKSLSTLKDDTEQRAMLAELKKLFDATREICKHTEQGNSKALSETALKFADASKKLTYVFNLRSNARKENQITDLSNTALTKAASMLKNVHQLAGLVRGEDSSRLENSGVKVANTAKTLLTTAQILETSLGDPSCKSTMLHAIDDVYASSQELGSTWRAIKKDKKYKKKLENLEKEREKLDSVLNNLQATCDKINVIKDIPILPTEKTQKWKSANNSSDVKNVTRNIEDKILELREMTKAVAKKASDISTSTKTLAASVGGRNGYHLDRCGELVADSVKILSDTIAKMMQSTGSTLYKYSVLAAFDAASASSVQLGAAWSPIERDPAHKKSIEELEHQREELYSALRKLKAISKDVLGMQDATIAANETTKQWLTFMKTMSDAKCALQNTLRDINKPLVGTERSVKSTELQRKACQQLARLNAAIASLIRASSDQDKPNQDVAEQATKCITQVMPNIINDVKLLSTMQDEKKRQITMDQLKDLFDATFKICKGVEMGNIKDANETVSKYVTASRELMSIINPSLDLKNGKEIEHLSKITCEKGSKLLTNVYSLLEFIDGENCDWLDKSGAKAVDTIQNLLTTVKITVQTAKDPHCKSELLSSVEDMASVFNALASYYNPLLRKPSRKDLKDQLDREREELVAAIDRLKAAWKDDNVSGSKVEKIPITEDRRLKFVTTMSAVKNKITTAEKEIDKPAAAPVDVPTTGLQRMLAQRLAYLNAAIASLIHATGNQANVNYEEADKASRTVAELIPEIIHNSNALSTSKDDLARRNMMNALKALCEASRQICLESELGHDINAYESVSKFADASSKLYYVFNPRADMKRENLIVELSKSVCDKASVLLSQVYQLAECTGGDEGAELDKCGAKVVDAAQFLLTNSQITGSTIDDPQCQSTLLSSADEVSALSRKLANTWSSLLEDPKRKDLKDHFYERLSREISELQRAIDELKHACKNTPDVPLKPVNPPVPKRTSSIDPDQNIAHDEKAQLAASVDEVIRSIMQTEGQIRKMYNETGDILSPEATQFAAQQLERKVVLADVAASHLVFCNGPEKLNCNVASKSAKTLSELFSTILKDIREVCNPRNLQAKAILDDTLVLCEAARTLCSTARDKREKLNEAAVDFANKSTELLYVIGTGVDPDQEKEVISRVKVIGDCASRLATCGAAAAQSVDAEHAQALCDAGGSCANATSHLLYISKLVAPSIQYPESQNILLTATDQLLSHVKQFSSVCSPLSSQSEQISSFSDLEVEGKKLERLLNDYKLDVENKKMVKRRKETILISEDSPMRQLASNILDSFKTYVESSDLSMEERRNYAQNADKLSAAIKELDIANAHCRNSPQDINALRELENSTQNLQQTILQCRVGQGQAQTNIVDLMDYVNDVVSNVETLSRTAEETNGEHSRKQLQSIKEECENMSERAKKMTTRSDPYEDENLTDGLILIDAFAQDCEKAVLHINESARGIADVQSRKELEMKAQRLTDSVNLLRFAVKSALATADSAALDETLHDLVDLENRIDSILQPIEGMKKLQFNKDDSSALTTLCCVAASPHNSGTKLTPTLAAYVTETRMHTDLSNPHERSRMEEHLRKVLYLMKTLIISTSRRMATWQEEDDGEVITITDQIIQELEDFDKVGDNKEKQPIIVVDNVDVRRLLLPPSDVHLDGDKNEISKKFNQTAAKLNSMFGTIVNSIQKSETLSTSLHTTADVAIELSTLARALKNTENRIESNRIEESAKDMCFATFNLLKVAEQVSNEPNCSVSRRRLLDACRSLNDCINKLSRTTKSKQYGDELVRNLQLQQAFLQILQPSCALNYVECVEALQNQSDVIYKMKSDEAMSREEGTATLQYITSTICNTSEYALQCAYLISISGKNKDAAKEGLLDVPRIQKLTETIQDNCVRIICLGNVNQIKDFETQLKEQVRQLQEAIKDSKGKIEDLSIDNEMLNTSTDINNAMNEFNKSLCDPNTKTTNITSCTFKILDAIAPLNALVKRSTLIPKVTEISPENRMQSDDVIDKSRELLNKTISLVKETNNSNNGVTTWVTYDGSRKAVLQAFDILMNSIKENGHRAGILESSQTEEEEPEVQNQSYIENQLDLTKKWLQKPSSTEEIKSNGMQGVNNVVKIAKEMAEDLQGSEKEEMQQVIDDVEKLSKECSVKYNTEKSSLLMERLLELRKMLERVVVTRVVEDFLEDDTPLGDLELLVDVEKDEAKRKYLLEQKIAELLAQMNRVTRTARHVADAGFGQAGSEIKQCSQQVELLAPSLVKATQERINSPHHQTVIDNYKAMMAQYADSMSKIRILCDRSVDPVDFVQAAGETMQRVREESSVENDPLKSAHASNIITRLGWRVVEAGLGSAYARRDPELRRALTQAQRRLQSALAGAGARASCTTDLKDVTAEILRTTSEVESALCGETIFLKQVDSNQPIFAAALDLHAAVREWSARDNEIVAVAKRMAVLMARLSDYMNQDKKRDVIITSKAIVKAASEVTTLARKLALECTDVRIRTNLLQLCDRIPTISGQLKMLTTVKGSGLGQGNQEDKEAINMLVGNAQNLMQSIQEVVNASAGASVKIMSQRGGHRMRWVRKNYYDY